MSRTRHEITITGWIPVGLFFLFPLLLGYWQIVQWAYFKFWVN